MRTLGVVSLALTGATLWARLAPAQDVRRQYAELHMGMAVRVVVYAADDATARRAARAAYARIAELEDVMSDYRPESEVRRLAARGGEPVRVSDDLFVVLARAVDLWRRSEGPSTSPWDRSSSCGAPRAAPERCRCALRSIPRPAAWGRTRSISTPSRAPCGSTRPACASIWAGSPRGTFSTARWTRCRCRE